MKRFLAIYSATRFWTCCTFSEDSSNNSEKNQKIFSVTQYFNYQKSLKSPLGCTFYHPAGVTSKWVAQHFFSFFYKGFEWNTQKVIPKKFADFIIAVTGNRIEEELGGVGGCPVLRVWSFEGARPRLAPVPCNSDYKNNPQGFEGIIFLCVFTYKYFGTFCYFVVSYVKRKWKKVVAPWRKLSS